MTFLANYGLFAAKIFTVLLVALLFIGGMIALAAKSKSKPQGKLSLTPLNDEFKEKINALERELLSKKEYKKRLKQQKQKEKELNSDKQKRVFILDFKGDIKASAVESLRQEVTYLLQIAKNTDEVVLRLESPGGMVNTYGLAASQLQRIRDKNIPLTVCVDKVAASGGYLMACVANYLIAAPFAILGSVGVVAQLPNFHRWLKHNHIDFEQVTAGEYKRTLTVFGENTNKDREKFKEEIQLIHDLFKEFVTKNRPQIDIQKVGTGEHWLAASAQRLNLVDKIMTSDDYLMTCYPKDALYHLQYETHKSLREKFSLSLAKIGIDFTSAFENKLQETRYY